MLKQTVCINILDKETGEVLQEGTLELTSVQGLDKISITVNVGKLVESHRRDPDTRLPLADIHHDPKICEEVLRPQGDIKAYKALNW
jgi:hypothetical protein